MKSKELVICPRCNRPAWNPDKVFRKGKNPEKLYSYERYRHPLDGRTKRNKTCYKPIDLAPPSHTIMENALTEN